MALINCPECSKEISDKVKACPHCGYPFQPDSPSEQIPQQVEVTSIKLKHKTGKKTKIIILSLIAIIALAIGIFTIYSIKKAGKEKQERTTYISNLHLLSISMYTGASSSEDLCNLTQSVWRNSIYKERDPKTDKYTISSDEFNDDFNDSLATLFSDSDTVKTIDSIKENQTFVSSIMKDLKNPTPEFEKTYDLASELYSAYQALTDLAINPQGNFQSFAESKQEKVDKFLEYYKKLDNQLPEEEN